MYKRQVLGAAFLPRLRERLGSDRLVLLSSVLYALVLVALALLRNLYLLVPVSYTHLSTRKTTHESSPRD